MPRMNILNTVEQEAFESAPVFNSFQRKQYFDFPQAIQQATANLRTPANQLCFLLSCGYFKASKRFFPARTFHPRDVEYVVGRTGLRLEQIELHLYAKETSSRHRGRTSRCWRRSPATRNCCCSMSRRRAWIR